MEIKRRDIIAAAAQIVFIVMLVLVLTDKAYIIDEPLQKFFFGIRAEWLTPAVTVITHLGSTTSVIILCAVLLAVKPTRLKLGVPLSIGAITVSALNKGIKYLVQRARPDEVMRLVEAGGFSFPSGHSITSMFVFGMLIYLVRRNIKNKTAANIITAVLTVPMITIGLSRIYLGVHYPTDVIAGWSLAILFIAAASSLYEKFFPNQDTV